MADTNTPTLTPDAMVAQLRAMRQQIPNYAQITPAHTRQLIAAMSVSNEMVTAAANAIGESAIVQAAVGATVDHIRQESSDASVWATLEEELTATLRGVVTANRMRRYHLGTITLQTYAITKTLAKRPEHADLLPHRDALRRTNRFRKAPRGTSKQDPQPAPQPSPDPMTI